MQVQLVESFAIVVMDNILLMSTCGGISRATGSIFGELGENTVIRGSVSMVKIDLQYGIEELFHSKQETPTFNENF